MSDKSRNISIVDVFLDMNIEEKNVKTNLSVQGKSIFEDIGKERSGDSELFKNQNLIVEAIKAQRKWMELSTSDRAHILFEIWKVLPKNLGPDSFDFYSDLIVSLQEYNNLTPYSIVFLYIQCECPLPIIGTIFSAALAAGCAIIACAPNLNLEIFSEVFTQVRLPEGLFRVVSNFVNIGSETKKNSTFKTVFIGDQHTAREFSKRSLFNSFNYLCPGKTAALLLDYSDVSAAIDVLLTESWGSHSNFWGVSTVIVQESIYANFLQKLKFQLDHFKYDNSNPKFRNKIMVDRIKNILEKDGNDFISKSGVSEEEWSPTFILNCQDQNLELDVPIIKILICRTAMEGVMLLNNCHYCLGVSIWTDISAQALEVGSMLLCNNIWINCHGCFSESCSFEPAGNSGNFICGGLDGMLEFMNMSLETETNFPTENTIMLNDHVNTNDVEYRRNLADSCSSAHRAFELWKLEKRRKLIIKKIADSMKKNPKLSIFGCSIEFFCYKGTMLNAVKNEIFNEFFIINVKVPIGVIAILIRGTINVREVEIIILLITSALLLGNAIILINEIEDSILLNIIRCYQQFLPKNLLNFVSTREAANFFAADPTIKAFWIYEVPGCEDSYELERVLASNLQKCWRVPHSNIWKSVSHQCLHNKIIWLPKVDNFP